MIKVVNVIFKTSLQFTATQRAVLWSTSEVLKTSTSDLSSKLQWPVVFTALVAFASLNLLPVSSLLVKFYAVRAMKFQLMWKRWFTTNCLATLSTYAQSVHWTICPTPFKHDLGSLKVITQSMWWMVLEPISTLTQEDRTCSEYYQGSTKKLMKNG